MYACVKVPVNMCLEINYSTLSHHLAPFLNLNNMYFFMCLYAVWFNIASSHSNDSHNVQRASFFIIDISNYQISSVYLGSIVYLGYVSKMDLGYRNDRP